jgi:type I restriction enzyme S subunit
MEWPIVKLGDITEVITKGTTPTSVGFKFIPEGVNFVKVESITSEGRFLPHKFAAISEECNESLKRSQLKEGDVLFSIAGALGRTALVTRDILPANTNQALAIIRLKAELVIDKHFLLLALTTSVTLEQVENSKGGVAQQNLSLGQLKGFEIPLPTISEQKRIVAILEKTFADIEQARTKTEENLKNARELFESYLEQVFSQHGEGWVEKPMSQLFKIKHGYAFKSEDFITDYEGDKPKVLTPGNYSEYGDLYFTTKNTKRCISEYPSDFLFKRNDLTIVMTDLSSKMKILGKPAFIKEDNVLHNQRIGKFEFLTNDVKKEFLYYFLLSGLSLKNIHSSATGATVRHTAPSRILNINIPYPASIVEQSRLADALDEVNLETKRLEDIYKAKLLQLDELKRSILQKAFSGELTKTLEVDTNKGAVA